jgi:hypothetical protein
VVIRSVRGARAQLLQQLLAVKEVVLIEHLVQIALNVASQGLGWVRETWDAHIVLKTFTTPSSRDAPATAGSAAAGAFAWVG